MHTSLAFSSLRLLLLVTAAGLTQTILAVPPAPDRAAARVTFADSVRELPTRQKATLRAMTAERMADRVGFNIPLPLHNQAELEARVNRGEVLSGEELRARYFPTQKNYDAVAAYLKGEGFTVDAIADTRLAVFVHGTAAQVQASFQTTMGLVNFDGTDRAVARTAPGLPAAIAGRVLGFSGSPAAASRTPPTTPAAT